MRRQLDDRLRRRSRRIDSGEISLQTRIDERSGFIRAVPVRDERAMPEYRIIADLHRRIKEPVTERTAFSHARYRTLDILAGSCGTMQHQFKIARPNLGVSGHRLAVQPDVVRMCAEKHAMHV